MSRELPQSVPQNARHTFASALPFFYGYVMMMVAMLVQICTSPGQTFAFSAFTQPLTESLNLSDSRLAFAYMLGTLAAAFPLSAVGPLSDRFGIRNVTLIAVVALAGACFVAANVTGFYSLLLAFFLLRFLGQGALSLLSGNAISMWFRSKIGRVSAIMSIGTGLAFAWIPTLLSQSIEDTGWRETYRFIGWLTLGVMIPVIWILFCNRPEDLGQRVDATTPDETDDNSGKQPSTPNQNTSPSDGLTLRAALRDRSYYILGSCNIVWAMTGTGVVFYLYKVCAEHGHDPAVGSAVLKTFGLAMLTMQLLGGIVADFLRPNRLLACGMLMLLSALTLITLFHGIFAFHGYALLFGGGQGLLLSVGSVVWVRYYGREHLGVIRGTVWCLTVAGSGCGPLIMGVCNDLTGSFGDALAAFAWIMLPVTIVAPLALPPAKFSSEASSGLLK